MDTSMLPEFISEAEENLEEMEKSLLLLEENPKNKEALNTVFRSMHSIKGNAEYLGIERIATLSHKTENLLELIRKEMVEIDTDLVDLLIFVHDRMTILIEDLRTNEAETTGITDLMDKVRRASMEEPEEQDEPAEPEKSDEPPDNSTDVPLETASFSDEEDNGLPEGEFPEELLQLRAHLYDLARGGTIDDNGRKKTGQMVADLLVQFQDHDEVSKTLNSINKQVGTLTYADDAGDLLAELNKLLDYVSGSNIGKQTDEAEAAPEETDFLLNSDDTYADEMDEELFDIFIQHLIENFTYLQIQAEDLKASDDHADILMRCREKVENLKASANYMDYKKIVSIYDKWASTLDELQACLFPDDDDDYKAYIRNGTESYITKITAFFPQCKDRFSFLKKPSVSKQQEEHKVQETSAHEEAIELEEIDALIADENIQSLF